MTEMERRAIENKINFVRSSQGGERNANVTTCGSYQPKHCFLDSTKEKRKCNKDNGKVGSIRYIRIAALGLGAFISVPMALEPLVGMGSLPRLTGHV